MPRHLPRHLHRVAAVALALAVTATLSTTPTSAAPYDRGRSTPNEDSYYPAKGDPTIDTLHYGLDLSWNRAARRLVGRATIHLRATQDTSTIPLKLSRRFTVRRVEVGARSVPFHRSGDDLVALARLTADQRSTVRLVYRGTPGPAAGPASRPDIARLGMRVTRDGQLWTMQEPFGAFTWYPVNDHPSDKALYDVRVSAPARWVGVSNGRLVSRRTAAGRTTTTWTNRHPVASYLMTLAVGPYVRHVQRGPRGLPISYWIPSDRPDLLGPLRTTPAALRWLERRLGRYPFDRFGVVVTPGSASAMETQTLVTFGVHNFRYGPFFVRSVVVHELAHQWYGDTVTPDDWRDVWMNEGMATYLHSRWEDAHSNQAYFSWPRVVREWASIDQGLRDLYGPPGAFRRDEFGSDNVYWSVALMWDRLRRRVGDPTFDRLVRTWPQTHLDSNADRAHLVAWWERHSGVELSAFFERWLTSPQSPA